MGYKFSLVLSREITESESAILQKEACADAVFSTDSFPTNADITVTRLDFDDTVSPTLADAIESALKTVEKVPELSVPGLEVPAQPAGLDDDDDSAAAVELDEAVAAELEAEIEEVSDVAAANGHKS